MQANRFFRFGVFLILCLLICACQQQPEAAASSNKLPAASPVATASPIKSIKIGYLPIGAAAPIFVAYEKGYFAEQGLDVQLESFRTGGEMIAPLGLGQLDVGSGEPGTALFNAIAQGVDVKVTLPMTLFHEGNDFALIAVRKDLVDDGVVTEVAGLKGKNVAINNVRGMSEYYTNEFLKSGGLTIDDVNIVVLPFPEMLQALNNRAVDAAYLQYPLAGVALAPGANGEPPCAVELIRFSDAIEGQQMGVIIYGKNLLNSENQETAIRVSMALIRAFRDLQGDVWRSDAVIVEAIAKYTGQSEEAARQSVIPHFEPNGILDGTSLLDMQRYYLDRGYTDYEDPLPLEEVMVTSFQEEAVARLGVFE